MPNPSTYFAGRFSTLAPLACVVDTSLPTFAGITSATPQNDGSVLVAWAVGTTTKPPLEYEVYCALGSVTASALFVSANRVSVVSGSVNLARVFMLQDQMTYLQPAQTYTFGVRSSDALSYTDTNTVILTATPSVPNYGTLAGAVWDQLESAHTVAGSFGVDVQEISADTDEIIATLGTPAHGSVSADLAEIATETDGIAAIPTNPVLTPHFDSVIGTPAHGSVSADIAEVAADTDTIISQTASAAIAAAVWNAVATSFNTAGTFGANLQTAVPTTAAVATAVWAALRASNSVSGSFGEALQGVFSTARAAELDLIPAIKAVTDEFTFVGGNVLANAQVVADKTGYSLTPTEESNIATAVWAALQAANTVAGSFGAALQGNIGSQVFLLQLSSIALAQYNALIAALGNIQNNTLFSGIVPDIMNIPNVGSTTYQFFANVFNNSGHPQDPDSNILNFTVKDNLGNILQAQTAMTRTGTGNYTGTFTVASTAVTTSVVVFFNYSVSSVAFQQTRTSTISTFVDDSTNIVAIKAKTDLLTFTGPNVNAQSQVVADKAGYALTASEHTTISGDVWDALIADYDIAGTFGANAQTPSINPAQVAEAVWDATTVSHDIPGTFGAEVQTPSLNPAQVAAAVWNAVRGSYDASGSFGEANQGVLSPARAAALDLVDATISSRASGAALDAAEEAILTAIGTPQSLFTVVSAVAVDPSTDILTVMVWLEDEGQLFTGPTSSAATVMNSAGVSVQNLGTQNTPSGIGTFRFQASNASSFLSPNQTYVIDCSITVGVNTYTTLKSFTVF